jgi:hypothetical protein
MSVITTQRENPNEPAVEIDPLFLEALWQVLQQPFPWDEAEEGEETLTITREMLNTSLGLAAYRATEGLPGDDELRASLHHRERQKESKS